MKTIYQIIVAVLGKNYTIDQVVAMIILRYQQDLNIDISYSSVKRNIQCPLSEWKGFSENFNDVLTNITAKNIRKIFAASEKEVMIV